MENNTYYTIIDEPKAKYFEHLIVNPIIILFAAMIIPLLIKVPFFGRWWLPFVWLVFNGIILGSPTIKKEILYSVLGLLVLTGIFFLVDYILQSNIQSSFSIFRYIVIIMYGIFFLFMYLVVFLQNSPYQIYQYVKDKK